MTVGMGVVVGLILFNIASVIYGLVKEESFYVASFINLLFWIFLGLPLTYGG